MISSIDSIEDTIIHHIGYSVVYWSWAETALADVIEIIESQVHPQIQTDVPVSLKRKLTYMRRAITQNHLPRDLANPANALVEAFTLSSNFRHLLVHGSLLLCDKSLRWQCYNLRPDGSRYEMTEVEYDWDSLKEEFFKIDRLCTQSQEFRELVWKWVGIEPVSE